MGELDSARPFRASDHGVAGPRRAKFRRILTGIYIDADVGLTTQVQAEAAWLHGRGEAVLGGRSAAAALGVKYLNERRRVDGRWQHFDPEPAVLIRQRSAGGRDYPGLTTHRVSISLRARLCGRRAWR